MVHPVNMYVCVCVFSCTYYVRVCVCEYDVYVRAGVCVCVCMLVCSERRCAVRCAPGGAGTCGGVYPRVDWSAPCSAPWYAADRTSREVRRACSPVRVTLVYRPVEKHVRRRRRRRRAAATAQTQYSPRQTIKHTLLTCTHKRYTHTHRRARAHTLLYCKQHTTCANKCRIQFIVLVINRRDNSIRGKICVNVGNTDGVKPGRVN